MDSNFNTIINAKTNKEKMSLFAYIVDNNLKILINCENKVLLGRIQYYDKELNVLLKNVKEMWTEKPKRERYSSKRIYRERFMKRIILRGTAIEIARSFSEQ